MKGLLLFSQSSDLLFIDADEEFLESAYKNEETEGDYKVKVKSVSNWCVTVCVCFFCLLKK